MEGWCARDVDSHAGCGTHVALSVPQSCDRITTLAETEPFPTLESIASYWKQEEHEMWVYINSLRDYLGKIIAHYESDPPRDPVGYKRRHHEIQFAEQTTAEK